jgi:hypothetical protein
MSDKLRTEFNCKSVLLPWLLVPTRTFVAFLRQILLPLGHSLIEGALPLLQH